MNIIIREAEEKDLLQIVKLMADDTLGSGRELYKDPLPRCYIDAFNNICNDKNSILLVICDGENVIGNLQITFTQYLSYMGSMRATIEKVRVVEDRRNAGIGTRLMNYAIDLAKEKGCNIVQLTSNKVRKDAHRFYKRLGFENSHEGMKLKLKI